MSFAWPGGSPARGLSAVLALAALACGSPPSERGTIEAISLTPGTGHYRSVDGGRSHRFLFSAEADQLLHLVVEQRGADVVVLLKDPSGLLFEVDTPSGDSGPETVLAVTRAAGEHTLVIEPAGPGETGAFDLIVREARPAGEADRLRAAAATVYARAVRRQNEKDFARAIPGLRDALARFESLGDRKAAAEAQWHLGESLLETGELPEAAGALESSLARFRDLGNGLGEARVLSDLGAAWRLLGRPGLAREALERSLRLYREAGNVPGQASALNNLGLILEKSGDLQGAIGRYEEALALWRQLGRRLPQAATLENLGKLYILIGHDAEGMDLLQRALALQEGGGGGGRVSILIALGWAHHLAGRSGKALDFYEEALALARRLDDPLAEAGAWDRRGSALRALRRYGEAAASYARALELGRAAGSPVSQAHTLANLGWLGLETGAVESARRHLRRSVELFESAGDPNGEASARVGLGRAERRLGAFGPARQQIDLAIRRVEEMRTGLEAPLSRGAFVSTRFDAYEELATLLMELHRRDPSAGHALEALEAAERVRARNLSEELAAGGSLSREAGEGRGGGSERTLRAEIRALDARRQALAAGNPRDARLRHLDAELRQLGLELDRFAGTRARPLSPLSAAGIRELAGDGSLLVVYLLAEPESFAWTVDRGGIEAHVLPGRERIETLARRMVAALSRRHQVASRLAGERAARELSAAILAPLGHRLAGARRLAILADGALHLVPFAGLPHPAEGKGSEPLLIRHEIGMLPSATFLASQRRRLADRPLAPGAVAVLADAVFSPDDDRLSGDRGGRSASGARDFQPAGPFRRLRYTAREAEAILRLVPRGESRLALGLEARRELVTSGALGRYRIVHFATHGLLHPVLPERSGIVLSLYDAQGRRRDGFLAAPDVAVLDLPAELVVLSACQTGLGRELRGEGLVGLTQAFFRAGARRVVVSHWNVQDQATAELMARFYRGLLVEHLPPADALRAAQLAIRATKRWKSPYFWAGFSLHGDWQ